MSRTWKTTKSREQNDQLFWPRDFNEFWKRSIKWLSAFWIPSRAVNTLLISVIYVKQRMKAINEIKYHDLHSVSVSAKPSKLKNMPDHGWNRTHLATWLYRALG